VLLSPHTEINVGISAATLNAPICAHPCAAQIATTARFMTMGGHYEPP